MLLFWSTLIWEILHCIYTTYICKWNPLEYGESIYSESFRIYMCWQMTKKISKVYIVLSLFTHTFPYPHARDFTNFCRASLISSPNSRDLCIRTSYISQLLSSFIFWSAHLSEVFSALVLSLNPSKVQVPSDEQTYEYFKNPSDNVLVLILSRIR